MIKHRLLQAVHTALVSALCIAVASPTMASSHREAPYITQQPKVDGTDFYAFASYEAGREDYITLLANYIPLQDAYGGPNYFSMDPNALYEIHIDNDGDAVEDVTFQWVFDNALAGGDGIALDIDGTPVTIPLEIAGPVSAENQDAVGFTEQYTLTMVTDGRRSGNSTAAADATTGETTFAKPLDFIGDKTFGDSKGYDTYVASLHNSGGAFNNVTLSSCPAGAQEARVFVGQRTESFSINLGRVFDLVNFDPINIEDDDANNILADKNITTLALEIHKDCLTGDGNGSIGAWTTASSPQVRILNPDASFERPEVVGGAWTQVSRLGSPLVNELVIGINEKNRFNTSQPADDGQFADFVTNPTVPAIINILFNSDGGLNPDGSIAPSNFPRLDLVTAFLTGFEGVNQLSTVTASEMLRLNTAIPGVPAPEQSNLGVVAGDLAGFPNGRRPGDDITDLTLRVAMGALCHNIAVDLNADGNLDEADNLNLCGGETPAENEAMAPVGAVPLSDGAPQNANQFDNVFPYLTTPISGSTL